jgi:hypothetical protein
MTKFRACLLPVVAEIDLHPLFGWDCNDAFGISPEI